MNVPYPLPTRQPYTGERVKELFHAAGTAISEIALKLGMKLSVEQLAA
ncbi:hypothetical protein [Pseudomonas aeruginosa]|nr:hypothetical protein [Pseudomonas aeruginosa]